LLLEPRYGAQLREGVAEIGPRRHIV
jgi:hypothetical protein